MFFSFLAVLLFVCIDLIDLRRFAAVLKAAFVGSLDERQTSAILHFIFTYYGTIGRTAA